MFTKPVAARLSDGFTAKRVRTTVQGSRRFVGSRTPFESSNGNLYGEWRTTAYGGYVYVVYSYGPHWPLFVYFPQTGKWIENTDKCSVTTSKHLSCSRPRDLFVGADVTYAGTDAMLRFLNQQTHPAQQAA